MAKQSLKFKFQDPLIAGAVIILLKLDYNSAKFKYALFCRNAFNFFFKMHTDA